MPLVMTQAANIRDEARAPSIQKTRVFVADSLMNSQLIEAALKRSHYKFEVNAFAAGSDETFRELDKTQPEVALISSKLQDGPLTGFKVLQLLRESESKTSAIMLLDLADRDLVIDAFRTGARGVFTRAHSMNALSKCICAVHRGERWVSNDQVELLLDLVTRLKPLQITKPGGMALLTPREQEIAELVTEGMRNEEIARNLNVTEHTVRNYLSHIFDKLGMSSRVELVLYVLSR
jgi:two-component system, NarL family, nitrate/nitrite response regulator NarL